MPTDDTKGKDTTKDGSGRMRHRWHWLRGETPPPAKAEPEVMPDTWEGKGDVLLGAEKLNEALECYTRGLTHTALTILPPCLRARYMPCYPLHDASV